MSDPSFRSGQTLPAAALRALGEYGIWTPTLTSTGTNPTLGSGAVTDGIYHRNGRLITVFFNITFGNSGAAAGTGTYQIGGFPYPITALGVQAHFPSSIRIVDSGTAAYQAHPRAQGSTLVQMDTPVGAGLTFSSVAAGVPFTWTNNDSLRGGFCYIADI